MDIKKGRYMLKMLITYWNDEKYVTITREDVVSFKSRDLIPTVFLIPEVIGIPSHQRLTIFLNADDSSEFVTYFDVKHFTVQKNENKRCNQ